MQDTCTNCQSIKNVPKHNYVARNAHFENSKLVKNKKCAKNNCNYCTQNINVKTKNKKLFTIMISLWLFAFMLLVPTMLFANEQKIDKTNAAVSFLEYYYILAIDLNLDGLGLGATANEQITSQFTDIVCETKYVLSGTPAYLNDDIDVNNDGISPIDAKISRFTTSDYGKTKLTNFSNYTLKLSICDFHVCSTDIVTVKYNSINLTNLYNKINDVYNESVSSSGLLFKGFKLQFPTNANATINSNNNSWIFSSTDNLFGDAYRITDGGETYYSGLLLRAEWGAPVTNADVNINISVNGANNSGVVLYLIKDGVMLSQVAQAGNGNIVIQDLKIGDTYELLISKPYMWSITASGSGTLTGCKYAYTVQDPTSSASINTITLTFSGGATTNSVIII